MGGLYDDDCLPRQQPLSSCALGEVWRFGALQRAGRAPALMLQGEDKFKIINCADLQFVGVAAAGSLGANHAHMRHARSCVMATGNTHHLTRRACALALQLQQRQHSRSP